MGDDFRTTLDSTMVLHAPGWFSAFVVLPLFLKKFSTLSDYYYEGIKKGRTQC
jgi:hypothetical protein